MEINTFAWGFRTLPLMSSTILIMAKNRRTFTQDEKLRTLIEGNRQLLVVLNRFGLSFGFGDKTVETACREDGVDCGSFLAVCNLLCGRSYSGFEISLPSLMGYLRRAHSYFLDFLMPSIRRKLIEAVNCSDINDMAFLLIKFFDDYVREVHNHMEHENDAIFDYVNELLEGRTGGDFRITDYSVSHVSMAEKLNGLKDIFIRHYHVKDNVALTSALMDIIYCGDELVNHCEIENRLFIPAVERLEKSLKLTARDRLEDVREHSDNVSPADAMTAREKEIICCVAKGMANKEIADHLCLSVHTVTTHRRNISSKLQVHSAAGLTIFAIMHGLITMEEVKSYV